VTANFNGERLCVHCKKRLKFDGPNGHYASTCPRCGKSQPER
jgi:predicted amidophosphoribosyltransferase